MGKDESIRAQLVDNFYYKLNDPGPYKRYAEQIKQKWKEAQEKGIRTNYIPDECFLESVVVAEMFILEKGKRPEITVHDNMMFTLWYHK